MADIQYKIRAFDVERAQITVDVEGLPSELVIDLPLDEAGNVPEGVDLDSYIMGFIPVFELERNQRLAKGVANAEAITSRIEPRTYQDEEIPASVEISRDQPLFYYMQAVRWKYENKGITFNNINIPTDDRAKNLIMQARIHAQNNPEATHKWVWPLTDVHDFTSAEVIALSDAVSEHISRCFQTYATIYEALLENENAYTYDAIDLAFHQIPRNYTFTGGGSV